MDQEKFNVTWPSYTDHLKEMLYDIWNSNELTDVTIFCEDKKRFDAHRVVLSACSPVFRSIISNTNVSNQVIYLRGIYSHEVESLLMFIYLGETTFYKDRIDEFLNVAKSLEIKEISNDIVKVDINQKDDDVKTESEAIPSDDSKAINTYVEANVPNVEMANITIKPDLNGLKSASGYEVSKDVKKNILNGLKYLCDYCLKPFKAKESLLKHLEHKHKRFKHLCDQCDYKSAFEQSLKEHIRLVHDQTKLACEQCEYKGPSPRALKKHIEVNHEGVNYPCNQCDHKATQPSHLKNHIQSQHEGVKFPCELCNYEATQMGHLQHHVKKYHVLVL